MKKDEYAFYDEYPNLREVLILGSANSGKSSLINALNNNKDIARTAKRTGKTQSLNFYLAQSEKNKKRKGLIVDTPGYGYSYIPIKVRQKLQKMLYAYLGMGVRVNLILLAINGHIGIKATDREMLDALASLKKPVQVVLTKIDRMEKKSDLVQATSKVASELRMYSDFVYPEIYLTSARDGFGMRELRGKVAIAFEESLKI